ncbi:MAG: hypothetical protein PVG75_01915 [Thioalkalispiraceae bacterium]|jgi:hypothetical protein
MRLPKWIYEIYPVLYILSGLAAITLVDSSLCFLSGLILVAGGVAILFMRRNYRMIKQHLAQLS